MRYKNCNDKEIEVSNDMQMFGLSWLWQLAGREKDLRVKNVVLEAHGIVGDFLMQRRKLRDK